MPVIGVLWALVVGSGCDGDVARFLARIQSTDILAGNNQGFVFRHTEFAQCGPSNGGLFGDALEPAGCDSLSPDRTTKRTIAMLDPVGLGATALNLPADDNESFVSDGERLAWLDQDAAMLHVYTIADASIASYSIDDDRLGTDNPSGMARGFAVALKGDYVALRVFEWDLSDSAMIVFSISANAVVREFETYFSKAAIEGDWVIFETISDEDVGPDFLDVNVINILTGETRVLAEAVDDNSIGGEFWGYDGRVFWTTGSLNYVLHGYHLEDDVEDFGRSWDFSAGSFALEPLGITEIGMGGILLVQNSSSNPDVVGYRLVPWEEGAATTTLNEFDATLEGEPWFRNNDLRFGGTEFVIWTDPQTGEFVVYDRAMGESGRYDPLVRDF